MLCGARHVSTCVFMRMDTVGYIHACDRCLISPPCMGCSPALAKELREERFGCAPALCMRRSPEGLVELVKGVGKIQGSTIHEVSYACTVQQSALSQHISTGYCLPCAALACMGMGSGLEAALQAPSCLQRLPVETLLGVTRRQRPSDCHAPCRTCSWRATVWSSTRMLWWSAPAQGAASQQRCLRRLARRYAAQGLPDPYRTLAMGCEHC